MIDLTSILEHFSTSTDIYMGLMVAGAFLLVLGAAIGMMNDGAFVLCFIAAFVFVFAGFNAIERLGMSEDINTQISSYIQAEGGLDSPIEPEMKIASKVYDLYKDPSLGFQETISYTVGGVPNSAALIFTMSSPGMLTVSVMDTETGKPRVWDKAVAISGSDATQDDLALDAQSVEINNQVSEYLMTEAGLDIAPTLNVAQKVNDLTAGTIESFDEAARFTIDGKDYPVLLSFTTDSTGALDIVIVDNESGEMVDLSREAVIKSAPAGVGAEKLTFAEKD